jgi:hypothetical protein
MALVADTQYGFPGEVTPAAWAQIIGHASGGVFGVGTSGSAAIGELKLTTNAVGDRGASLSAGTAYGHGCVGIWNGSNQFNFAAASGTSDRWDCVVVRRTWSNTPGASVTTLAVKTGTSSRALPALVMTPGTQTEQPLWLVRVRGGQTSVQEIVDLRCFASNAGVQCFDVLSLNYLNWPGSRVEVSGEFFEYKVNSTSTSVAWEKVGSSTRTPLWGVGNALAGAPGAESFFLIQAGTTVQTSDNSGYSRITWPKPFPNGLLYVMGFNGDDWSTGGSTFFASAGIIWGAEGFGTKTSWVYALLDQPASANGSGTLQLGRRGNRLHRINWFAIGF